MGDAGIPPPALGHDDGVAGLGVEDGMGRRREVTVLVTGFGPFKSFLINPSFLIASKLPPYLYPESDSELGVKATTNLPPSVTGIDTTNQQLNSPLPISDQSRSQPTIRVVSHPQPIRVSYNSASHMYPAILHQRLPESPSHSRFSPSDIRSQLLSEAQQNPHHPHQDPRSQVPLPIPPFTPTPLDPDFILHLGVAGGRDHFALEILARRDGYIIKDVDDSDGKLAGETRWKKQGLPEVLRVGWDGDDVLRRWREEVGKVLGRDGRPLSAAKGARGATSNNDKVKDGTTKELVRLSTDAGKFLCEFVLYESLGLRAVEEAGGRKGKVAFLHVPGPVDRESIERGVKVAECAIRALVASWEDGFRAEGFAV